MKKIPKAEFINELGKWGKIFFRTDEGFLENNETDNEPPYHKSKYKRMFTHKIIYSHIQSMHYEF